MPGKEEEAQSLAGTQQNAGVAVHPRLLSKVAFGVSVAVLAGVAVVTVPAAPSAGAAGAGHIMITVGLDAAINGGIGGPNPTETTCCG